MMTIRHWSIIVAIVMLTGTLGLLQSFSHGEPVLIKKPFSDFPLHLGGRWQGSDLEMKKEILDVLRVSDYMMRVYAPLESSSVAIQDGGQSVSRPPLYFYVGYYQSQRTGATYHSPKNCLPGAGWQFIKAEPVAVPLAGGQTITINRAVIQKGLDKQLILYWYHDRGRVIASEYWAKGYMVWDAMTKNRTDGALVRISLPIVGSEEAAYQYALTFLQDLWPFLPDFLPAAKGEL